MIDWGLQPQAPVLWHKVHVQCSLCVIVSEPFAASSEIVLFIGMFTAYMHSCTCINDMHVVLTYLVRDKKVGGHKAWKAIQSRQTDKVSAHFFAAISLVGPVHVGSNM